MRELFPDNNLIWEYRDERGYVLYFHSHKGKYFHLEGDEKVWGRGSEPLLYNLPELISSIQEGKTILFVEGEKDVETARSLGYVATTSGGVTSWRDSFSKYFRNADVVIVPDNDKPGREYADEVAKAIHRIAKRVRILELPGLEDKEDLTDWVRNHDGDRDQLEDLINFNSKKYDPTNPTNSANLNNLANFTNPIITAADLMAMELDPVEWVIEGVLPEGVSLLAGKPKKGKSWMALQMCEAIARGDKMFGSIPVKGGETLYLALEDNVRRLHKRLKKILKDRHAPNGLHLTTDWPKLHAGGAEMLDSWLEEHPNARLVVIDTLAKVRRPVSGRAVYQEDYAALESLLPIAAKHSVAIVVVHHLRQLPSLDPQDEISGSTGLTGGVDGWLILRRTPGSKGPTLLVDGRDIEEPKEYALNWNALAAEWTIEGDAAEAQMSKERAEILDALRMSPEPLTPKEVADVIPDAKHNNVKYLMWSMLGDGQLLKDDKGRYRPVSELAELATPTNPNPESFADTYAENDNSISGVSGVSEVSTNPEDDHPKAFEAVSLARRPEPPPRPDTSEAWPVNWIGSFETMREMEPGLGDLENDIAWIAHSDDKSKPFCANATWYGWSGRESLKKRLGKLVGWYSPNPKLRSPGAYNMAYRHLYDMLPDCRDCACLIRMSMYEVDNEEGAM
jgi:hypothetical protein